MTNLKHIVQTFVDNVYSMCDNAGISYDHIDSNIYAWVDTGKFARNVEYTIDGLDNEPGVLCNTIEAYTIEANLSLEGMEGQLRLVQFTHGTETISSYWELCDNDWNIISSPDGVLRFLTYKDVTNVLRSIMEENIANSLTIVVES